MSKQKRAKLDELLAQVDPSRPLSQEERDWLDMAPVGREFGSADASDLDGDADVAPPSE